MRWKREIKNKNWKKNEKKKKKKKYNNSKSFFGWWMECGDRKMLGDAGWCVCCGSSTLGGRGK